MARLDMGRDMDRLDMDRLDMAVMVEQEVTLRTIGLDQAMVAHMADMAQDTAQDTALHDMVMEGATAVMEGPQGPPGPNGEMPLTAQVEQSTAAAFQVIDQIVQAFGGFAQMLESTFFATHSSFMAMVGVAEQLGPLRDYLGRAVSALTFVGLIKRWFRRLSGRGISAADAAEISAEGFEEFNKAQGDGKGKQGKSQRPVFIFILFMFGIPWLMSKLIQRLQRQRLEAAAAAAAAGGAIGDGNAGAVVIPGPDGKPLQPSQIKDLEFCRALYDFTAESPAELSFKKGDIIAILSKLDPATRQPSMWWRGRLRSGPIGHFPANYVEIIEKRTPGAESSQEPNTQQNMVPMTSENNQLPPQEQFGFNPRGPEFNSNDFSFNGTFG
ncbi:Peroxisomal membrane protein PAS20 [Blyttiomyces sp. JEL0837]|nr:Peroxisomal membrane protein PAS20 [Blyttiomyces sp. JEL0837]